MRPGLRESAVVIGGGMQGCAIALHLALAGWRVTLMEKSVCGRHASAVNAGGIRMLMRAPAAYPLSLHAMSLWERMPEILGETLARDIEFIGGTGQLAVAITEEELAWCETRAAEMRALGLGAEEVIDAAGVISLLPGVTSGVRGGLISRRDGHGNPARTARAYCAAAAAAGVRIVENCRVTGAQPAGGGWQVETSQGSFAAGTVVNCGGAWGSEFAASLGDDLPVEVLALSMMVTARVRPFLKPVVLGISRALSFKQTATGTLVIGGGMLGQPMAARDTSFTVMDRMVHSAATLLDYFPGLAGLPVLRTWTGLEAETADLLPYIGPSPNHPGLWHAFGFCGEGFQLAPAVGETVARSLTSGTLDPRLEPFSPARLQNHKQHQQETDR